MGYYSDHQDREDIDELLHEMHIASDLGVNATKHEVKVSILEKNRLELAIKEIDEVFYKEICPYE
tara:strand:+ start:1275 stop:1469 length:195 start_codon:yes stop_codon:yes gene_type:complete